jgi:hypothetical protein
MKLNYTNVLIVAFFTIIGAAFIYNNLKLQKEVSFTKPELKYISVQDWQNTTYVQPGVVSCGDGVKEIRSRIYCLKAETGAAAGSSYTTYTYFFPAERVGKTINFKFTLRYSQCDNYDEPKKSECKKERESFNVDEYIAKQFEEKYF